MTCVTAQRGEDGRQTGARVGLVRRARRGAAARRKQRRPCGAARTPRAQRARWAASIGVCWPQRSCLWLALCGVFGRRGKNCAPRRAQQRLGGAGCRSGAAARRDEDQRLHRRRGARLLPARGARERSRSTAPPTAGASRAVERKSNDARAARSKCSIGGRARAAAHAAPGWRKGRASPRGARRLLAAAAAAAPTRVRDALVTTQGARALRLPCRSAASGR